MGELSNLFMEMVLLELQIKQYVESGDTERVLPCKDRLNKLEKITKQVIEHT